MLSKCVLSKGSLLKIHQVFLHLVYILPIGVKQSRVLFYNHHSPQLAYQLDAI